MSPDIPKGRGDRIRRANQQHKAEMHATYLTEGGFEVRTRGVEVEDINESTGGAASSPPEAVIRRAAGDESAEDAAAREKRLSELIAKMRNN